MKCNIVRRLDLIVIGAQALAFIVYQSVLIIPYVRGFMGWGGRGGGLRNNKKYLRLLFCSVFKERKKYHLMRFVSAM